MRNAVSSDGSRLSGPRPRSTASAPSTCARTPTGPKARPKTAKGTACPKRQGLHAAALPGRPLAVFDRDAQQLEGAAADQRQPRTHRHRRRHADRGRRGAARSRVRAVRRHRLPRRLRRPLAHLPGFQRSAGSGSERGGGQPLCLARRRDRLHRRPLGRRCQRLPLSRRALGKRPRRSGQPRRHPGGLRLRQRRAGPGQRGL